MKRQIRVKVRGKWHTVEVEDQQQYPFQVTVDGEAMEVEVEVEAEPGALSPTERRPAEVPSAGPVGLSAITQEDKKLIRSPMPGRIVTVSVKVWDEVTPGTEVCILETMKMEQSVHVPQRGIIRAVFVQAGQSVSVGDPLIQLE